MNTIDLLKSMCLLLIRSIYDAEKVLNDTLPKMKVRAVAEGLKAFIDEEVEEKRTQQARLEGIFALLKESPEGVQDNVVRYLSATKSKLAEKCGHNDLSDAMMIMLNRAMTIHLINTYRAAICCAIKLEIPEITRILRRSLLAETRIETRLRTLEESLIFAADTVELS